MDNNTKEANVRLESSKTELKARRITFWTAIVVLVSTLIPAIAAIFTYQEIKGFISRIVEKPFEGEWEYLSNYEKYYDDPNPEQLHGEGTAIILWKYSQHWYDVNLVYSIKRDHIHSPLLVTAFKGKLVPDATGWPSQQHFVMDNELLHRLDHKGRIHHLRKYQFKNCTYTRNGGGERPETIVCVHETAESKSNVTFTKKAGIH